MTPLTELPALDADTGRLNVVVDTPKGSRNKYKLKESDGQWHLGKLLPEGMSFPYNFGFIPSTRAEDGDPLDVLLMMPEPAFPGCVATARLIGVIEAEQAEGEKPVRNDRLIAVVETPHNPAVYRTLDEMSEQSLAEIEHFFVSYNQAEGRAFKPLGRHGPERARALLEAAMEKEAEKTNGKQRSQSKRSRKRRDGIMSSNTPPGEASP